LWSLARKRKFATVAAARRTRFKPASLPPSGKLNDMNSFKLGVVLESLGLPIRQALPEAARFGVQGVQFDAVGDLAPERLGETGRREIRTMLRSFNLELAAVGCPLRKSLDTFEHQQPRIDHIKAIMQLAFELGAKKVVVPMPAIPEEPVAEQSTEPKSFFTMNAAPPKAVTLRESLTALGQYGDRIGTLVCLEAGLDSGEKLRDYLNSYDHGSLSVTFDPANFLMNRHDPVTSLLALAKKIFQSHARDVRLGSASAGAQEVAVGAGDVEWLGYTAALAAIEYRGFVCAERCAGTTQLADTRSAIGFLRRFIPSTG
jgi:L-ribulose-5-phosphate 3-epimerase